MKIILILIISLITISCIGIKTEICFKDNYSGNIKVEYRIPQLLIDSWQEANDLQIAKHKGIIIPSLCSRTAIQKEIRDYENISLLEYDVRQDYNDTYISYTLQFTSTEGLSYIDLFPEISIDNENAYYTFQQNVQINSGIDPEDDIASLYQNYYNTFIVHAPRDVISHNIGKLSADNRTVTYSFPLLSNVQEFNNDYLIIKW